MGLLTYQSSGEILWPVKALLMVFEYKKEKRNMSVNFKVKCSCGSTLPLRNLKDHAHLSKRNHDDDQVKPEIKHHLPDRNQITCSWCGGTNPDCSQCGGSGRNS